MTSTGRFLRAGAVAALVALCWTPASAQNSSTQQLLNRVDRLQRELSTLQRYVYKGEQPPPPAAAPSSSSGASSSEASSGDPRTAARNSVRITQLENEIRSLTGRIEELDHRMAEIEKRLDGLAGDVGRRLTALEGGGTGAAAAGAASAGGDRSAPSNVQLPINQPSGGGGNEGGQASAGSDNSSAGRSLGAPPQPLGTIPGSMAVTSPRGPDKAPSGGGEGGAPQQQASASPGLPQGTPKEQYDYALSLMLQKQDFATAEKALKAFIGAHPKNQLAGNAYYWLGETYYVRKQYQDAAYTFAEGFQKHPKGNKAPDSLLKLGMSLAQLDKKREACTAYSRLLGNFPDANARLKARVQREQRRANCQ